VGKSHNYSLTAVARAAGLESGQRKMTTHKAVCNSICTLNSGQDLTEDKVTNRVIRFCLTLGLGCRRNAIHHPFESLSGLGGVLVRQRLREQRPIAGTGATSASSFKGFLGFGLFLTIRLVHQRVDRSAACQSHRQGVIRAGDLADA
jgi:hypothetical protein